MWLLSSKCISPTWLKYRTMAKRHFDAVCHQSGSKCFVLACSSLTGRVWDGALWVFADYADFLACPNMDMTASRTTSGVTDVLWLSNNRDILMTCDTGKLELWTCSAPGNSLQYSKGFGCHDDMALCLCSVSDEQCVSGGADGKVGVWDIETLKLTRTFRGHCGPVWSIASHPSSSGCFMTAAQDGLVRQWDLRLPKPARKFTGCREAVYSSVAWSNQSLALGSEQGTVEVYDVRGDPLLFATYSPHTRPIRRLTFAPWNCDLLASGSDDCSVCIEDINTNGAQSVDRSHHDFVRGLSWDSISHTLLSCAWDGQVVRHLTDQNRDPSNGDSSERPATVQPSVDMFANEENNELS